MQSNQGDASVFQSLRWLSESTESWTTGDWLQTKQRGAASHRGLNKGM